MFSYATEKDACYKMICIEVCD